VVPELAEKQHLVVAHPGDWGSFPRSPLGYDVVTHQEEQGFGGGVIKRSLATSRRSGRIPMAASARIAARGLMCADARLAGSTRTPHAWSPVPLWRILALVDRYPLGFITQFQFDAGAGQIE
jgi:hypothetical protein